MKNRLDIIVQGVAETRWVLPYLYLLPAIM